jgi:hypothetical protein
MGMVAQVICEHSKVAAGFNRVITRKLTIQNKYQWS